MTQKLAKMPKITDYKTVIKKVKEKITFRGLDDLGDPIFDPTAELPKLDYKGTIKMHGSNGALVYTWDPLSQDYLFHAQSKNTILSITQDNLGFANYVYATKVDGIALPDAILDKLMKLNLDYTPNVIAVYGEWCGGSIQAKVALNKLEKMFVVFGVKIDDQWLDGENLQTISSNGHRVYNVLDFPSYDMTIDFNHPAAKTNELGEITLAVEACCPVGKAFDVEGIGEGVVWKCVSEGWKHDDYWFKVKGDEHAKGGGKVKILAPVDVEKIENIKTLMETLVTERRLEQGFEYLTEMNIPVEKKNIPVYIKWVVNDVLTEELDTIEENGFTVKDVSGKISEIARNAFFAKENELSGL